MKTSRLISLVFAAAAFWTGATSALASESECRLIDLETPVEQLASQVSAAPEAEQIAAYRSRIMAPHAPLYEPGVLGEFPPEALNEAIARSLEGARSNPRRRLALGEVRTELKHAEQRFHSAFPDFRCDFPIYLIDSLGRLDGAGRVVDHRPALVLGVDQIEKERQLLPLPVFLAHELFHRYHSQASGFSDDPGEHQAIWRALWAEGLATYVSYRLTPGASLDQALIAPRDLAARSQPQITCIAKDLLAHFDQVDHDTYQTYFTYGDPQVTARGLPWRSGYYVGFLVAQDLGRTRSLRELAALQGPRLQVAIRQSLARLARRAD